MYKIQKYALKVGMVTREMLCNLHSYHLDDDPSLLSSSILFDRIHDYPLKFRNTTIPEKFLENFYGNNSQDIPKYIHEKELFMLSDNE